MGSNRFFWAVYLILVGLMLLITVVFRLAFDGFGAAFAILLLLCGLSILLGEWGGAKGKKRETQDANWFVFGPLWPGPQDADIGVFLSDACIELPAQIPRGMRVRSFFGRCVIKLPEGWSVRADVSVAFGAAQTPEGSIHGFGRRVDLLGDGQQCTLYASSLFGYLQILD